MVGQDVILLNFVIIIKELKLKKKDIMEKDGFLKREIIGHGEKQLNIKMLLDIMVQKVEL